MKKVYLFFLLLTQSGLIYSQTCTPVISGPSTVCAGSIVSYSASSNPPSGFSWSVNGGGNIVGSPVNPSNPQVNWTSPGTWVITVRALSCPGSPSATYSVTVVNSATLPAPTQITGPTSTCTGTTSVYSVPTVAGQTPIWVINSSSSFNPPPVLTPSGNQVSIAWPPVAGNYTLNASYSNGTCIGSSRSITISNSTGTAPVTFSGTDALCVNQATTYFASGEPGDTYVWSLPSGGTFTPTSGAATTVTWTGVGSFPLSVTASNSCGSPRTATKTISVGVTPTTPGVITKQNTVTCLNQTERLSIAPVSGATSYYWTIGLSNGNYFYTTSTPYLDRTYTTSGPATAFVSAYNGYCYSPPSPTFNYYVGIPSFQTSFPSSVCVGVPQTFSITSSGDMTGYTFAWYVGDGVIIGPSTGSSVSIQWNTVGSKSVSAVVTTPCGNQIIPGPPSLPPQINVQNSSYTLYPISGVSQACLGQYTYSATTDIPPVYPNPIGATPTWSITLQGGGATTGGTISSTQYTNATINWNTPGNYTVTASVTNACGNTQTQSLNVTVANGPKPTTALINGATSEIYCTSSFPSVRSYSVPSTSGYTYNWQLYHSLPGDLITSSSSTASVTWSGQAVSGVTVTPSTALCSGERTYLSSSHQLNSTIGTLSLSATSACVSANVPITLSLTSANGNVSYLVRKKGDNGAWSAWTTISPSYTIDYTGFSQPVYSVYHYEFQAIAQNGTCAQAYSNVVTFTGYVPPYFSNPTSYFYDQEVCSGANVSLTPTSNTPGTSFSWTSSVSGPVSGATASGTGNISDVLVNTGSTIGVVTYNITPTANGCSRPSIITKRYVYPTPIVALNQSKAICSGANADYNISVSPEVELSWPDPDGSGPATSVSNRNWTPDILDQLTNTGTSPLLVTYQVTPFYRINGSLGCSGATANVVITVNPKPIMTGATSGVGCNNTPLSYPLTSSIPSTFQWYASNNPSTTGESLSIQSSSIINNTITTNSTQTVNYTVTPISTNGCFGNSQTVPILINASPPATIATPSGTGICANGSVVLNANSGAGLSYQWFKGGVSLPGATASSYSASSVGSYTVQVTNSSTGCSNVSTPTVVSLVKCSQTITFGALSSKTYGEPSFSLSGTASSGLQVTYTSSNSSVATISGNTVTITGAGTTTITASQAGNVDFFAATSVPQTLTVSKATLSASANSANRPYGAANPTFTISYAGFMNGETASVIDTAPTTSTTATATSNVGTYPITVSGGSDNNYTFTYVSGTLTVNKATLQVTADNKTRTYGAINPTFTFSYAGFLNGETATVIDTPPTGSTSAGASSNVGTYAITPSGGSDNNYTFNYVTGTLNISKATIQATANASRPYNTSNPIFAITYTGLLNGETASVIDAPPTATTTATTSSPVGSYTITLSGGSDNNYSITRVNGTLTITKANQTVTFSPIPVKCGTGAVSLVASSSSGLTVVFSSSNTAIATISGSTANALQTGTVTITASQPGNANYNSASATQSLLIASLPAKPGITQIGCVCEQYVTLQASGGSNYVWSTGYAGQTVNMVTSADYYVTSTGANGCSRQSNLFTAIIPSCTSDPCGGGPQSRTSNNTDIKSEELQVTEATLYPNPADATLTIHLPEPVQENLTVSLYSQFGQEVKSAVLVKGEYKIEFDTKFLSKGMYVLTLRTTSGNINMNRKVIINH
jgi:MBG domain (YGX type)/PKD-like domain/Secretion system C-terminal sorting domain